MSAHIPTGELRPGLHRIQAPLGDRFVALYLLLGSEHGLLFDTGIGESIEGVLLPYLAAHDIAPERITWAVNSHCDFDHTGGNAALKAAIPGVMLLAGALDAELTESLDALIERRYGEFRAADGFDDAPALTEHIREVTRLAPLDGVLHGGETFELGDRVIRVLHTPGHSPGHVALVDETNRALLIGDATLGESVLTADGEPAFPPTYRDPDPYLASIQAFRELQPELLLTAHYPVYERESVETFLRESEEYVARVDRAIESGLQGTMTTLQLIHAIAPRLGAWAPAAAEYLIFPVTGNLERLERQGVVRSHTGGPLRTWEPAR